MPDKDAELKRALEKVPHAQDALASLMRNVGFLILSRGKEYSSRKHNKVDYNSFAKYLRQMTDDMESLTEEERRIVAKRFVQWIVYIAVSSSGEHLNSAFIPEKSDKEQRRTVLKRWVKLLDPAIRQVSLSAPKDMLDPLLVTDALLALDAGEQHEMFTPSRRVGKHANSFSLAKDKYKIRYLRKRLRRGGLSAQKVNKLVESATKVQPEAVRKWQKPIKQILSSETVKQVRRQLRESVRDETGKPSVELLEAELMRVGQHYMTERNRV